MLMELCWVRRNVPSIPRMKFARIAIFAVYYQPEEIIPPLVHVAVREAIDQIV